MKAKIINTLYSFSLLLFITAFGFQHNPPSGWYQQFMPDLGGRQISDIFFLDSLTGWAVTPFSTQNDTVYVLKTSNGGDNWFINYTGTGQFVGMKRIYFLNDQTGYACGNGFDNSSQNNFAKSTNGGANWFNINPPDPFLVYDDFSILNEDTIWLAASSGTTGGVFRTTNGGSSWQQQYSAGSNNPQKIYMNDANLGFISTGITNNGLRRTTDGGATWTEIQGVGGFKEMFFINSLTGWKTIPMKKTSDGGLTWVEQYTSTGGYIQTSGIYDFSNVNGDTIWGVGGYVLFPNNQVRAILHRTINGGDNWHYQIPDTSIKVFPFFIDFRNSKIGWGYDVAPTGIHTVTGGDSIFLSIKQISSEIPSGFNLYQNYPNPFNPITRIKFDLQKSGSVKLMVHDILGKEVSTLVNERLTAGSYEYTFDAVKLPSGAYFYSLFTEESSQTKKMLLTK